MNICRRAFTQALRGFVKPQFAPMFRQTRTIINDLEREQKIEVISVFYTQGLFVVLPVFTACGGFVGTIKVFNKKNFSENIVDNFVTIIGGIIMGGLVAPFYPAFIVYAPFKFIYEIA